MFTTTGSDTWQITHDYKIQKKMTDKKTPNDITSGALQATHLKSWRQENCKKNTQIKMRCKSEIFKKLKNVYFVFFMPITLFIL